MALPLLTTIADLFGIVGGYVAEATFGGVPWHLYFNRAFSAIEYRDFVPATLKTAVFGLIIGTVGSFLGFTASHGTEGAGRASTRSVVLSSILIIASNVLLVRFIFFLFPVRTLNRRYDQPAIRLEGVSKSFDGRAVLNDVSLDLPEGSGFCLLGRSGTGKSVPLKHIIGLMKPDRAAPCGSGSTRASCSNRRQTAPKGSRPTGNAESTRPYRRFSGTCRPTLWSSKASPPTARSANSSASRDVGRRWSAST